MGIGSQRKTADGIETAVATVECISESGDSVICLSNLKRHDGKEWSFAHADRESLGTAAREAMRRKMMPRLISEAAAARRSREGGKKSAVLRWAKNDEKYEDLRTWFQRHMLENPRHTYGQTVTVAMDQFHLSRNTVKKHTRDLK